MNNDRPQTIFRIAKGKENPYAQIDRKCLENPNISFKAKGLLAYLLSRPDHWEINITDLINHSSTEKEAAIRAGIRELQTAGYMRYEKKERLHGRITGKVILVYEDPIPRGDLPHVVRPDVARPDVANQGQVINELSNKDKNKVVPNVLISKGSSAKTKERTDVVDIVDILRKVKALSQYWFNSFGHYPNSIVKGFLIKALEYGITPDALKEKIISTAIAKPTYPLRYFRTCVQELCDYSFE